MSRRQPRRDPARVGGAIGRVLSELGHDLTSPALVLAGSWEEIVGAEIAAQAEPVGWHEGVLEIAVSSPAWSQHLQLRQVELLDAMAELLGEGAPKSLRFRVR